MHSGARVCILSLRQRNNANNSTLEANKKITIIILLRYLFQHFRDADLCHLATGVQSEKLHFFLSICLKIIKRLKLKAQESNPLPP